MGIKVILANKWKQVPNHLNSSILEYPGVYFNACSVYMSFAA